LDLEFLRRGVRLLFNKYQADMNQHIWKLYGKAQIKYRKEIRIAGKKHGGTSVVPLNT